MTALGEREMIACQSALSWSLRGRLDLMDSNLAQLSPKGQAALLLALDTIHSALRLEPLARALLAPDSLPDRSAIANGAEIADDLDVDDQALPIAPHYKVRAWGEPGDYGVECACGLTLDGFDTAAKAAEHLNLHVGDTRFGVLLRNGVPA